MPFISCTHVNSDASTVAASVTDSIENAAHTHSLHLLQASDFCSRRVTPAGETVVNLLQPNQIDSILKENGFEITASEIAINDNFDQQTSEITTYSSPDGITVTLNESTITVTCPDKGMINAIGQSFVTLGFRQKGSSYGWPRVGDRAGICVTTTPTTLTISAPPSPL